MTRHYPISLTAAIIPATLLLAGCGITAQSEPQVLNPASVPYRLLSPTGATPAPSGTQQEIIYLVHRNTLVPARRQVPTAPTAATVLKDLLNGPTTAEQTAGLTTALPDPSSTTISVHVTAGNAAVTVGPGITSSGRSDQVLAFGQIVKTLTAVPGITTVTFTSAGHSLAVPRGDGSLTRQPLHTTDYP